MTLNTVLLCSILLFVSHVSALFEDQAGKFDWKQKYVGEVSHMGYYSNTKTSVLVVATKSHVVAGLDADNGVIRWRHVFEKEEIGHVWDLHVSQKTKHSVSVSGHELLFLRVWDSVSGALVVEHLVRADRVPDLVSVTQGKLVTVFYDGREMELVTYSYDNKKISEGKKSVIQTPFQVGRVGGASCKMTDTMVLVCATDRGIHSLDVGGSAWQSHQAVGVKTASLRVQGSLAELEFVSGKMARLDTETGEVKMMEAGTSVVMSAGCGGLEVRQSCETEGRSEEGASYCDTFSRELIIGEARHKLAVARGRVEAAWAMCKDSELVQVI